MFRFKQFDVHDAHCAMKVGTDGVLLGAWADVAADSRILDVGTGTGLIALMAAQRSNAHIVAVDIAADAVAEARRNVSIAPWTERIEVVEGDICTLVKEQHQALARPFDHIVSNPPYFTGALLSADAERNLARHAASLSFGSLIAVAGRLLRADGRLSVILPTDEAASFRREAYGQLWLTRLVDIITREGDEPKRTMMEFMLTGEPRMPRCTTLVLHRSDGVYSDDYRNLTQDFYIKF